MAKVVRRHNVNSLAPLAERAGVRGAAFLILNGRKSGTKSKNLMVDAPLPAERGEGVSPADAQAMTNTVM